MKFECNINATAPTIFSEQLNNVIDLLQQWNDCERAVMLFAVLKRVPYPITKFLQSVINTSLQQAQSKEQVQALDRNANCAKYINSLFEIYKSFKYIDTQLTTDSIFYESDRSIDNIDKYYDKKEEILLDLLKMMPVLTIGNDEAKEAYLQFIPMTVSDATRRIVSSTLVQQIFCYVLIHPAFSIGDRESVIKYLKDLEAHISSNEPNLFLYRNGSSPSPIAPPQSKSTETISWESSHHLSHNYGEDNDYRRPPAPKSSSSSYLENSNDDRHTSFMANGRIVNYVDDTNKSNTQLGFVTLPSVTKHITTPDDVLDKLEMEAMGRTYRSHSLTNAPLAQNKEKQRSNSVDFQNFSGSCASKPLFQPSRYHHTGMSNIEHWLKTLRLHKYTPLFSNLTYEQLLSITEDHLTNVTLGARKKLVNCVQKLKERYGVLCQVEKDLLCGQITIGKTLEELSTIVLTPMKPVEKFNKQDVASQFLKVLGLASTKMATRHIVPQDEEYISTLLWILEKAVHSEAFVAHTNVLREHRYNMQRIKNQFPSKSHYSKSNASSAPSNIHRQRAPIEFIDYLPKRLKTPPTPAVNRPQYSTVAKAEVFKIPQPPPPAKLELTHTHGIPQRKIGSPGSVGSIGSSGYLSDQGLSYQFDQGQGYLTDSPPIGMGNIRKWLKSLRLHKYDWVFNNVAYEKMFTFTQEYLKGLDITDGASRKLAGCIEKLKTRTDVLKQIDSTLSQNQMFVPDAIFEMESMVLSPMKPMRINCDMDVGFHFWKVLNLIFNLLSSNNYDDQTVQSFQRMLESSMNSEAFVDYVFTLREMRMKLARQGRRMIR